MDDQAGVYYILNTHNNKIYIGQSMRINNRISGHIKKLNKGRHINAALQNDWSVYGGAAFEFGTLVTVPWYQRFSGVRLGQLERSFISTYQATNPDFGYNVDKSEVARDVHRQRADAREKIAQAQEKQP